MPNSDNIPDSTPINSDALARAEAIKTRKGLKSAFSRIAAGIKSDVEELSTIDDSASQEKFLLTRSLSQSLTDLELKFQKLEDCQQIILRSFQGSEEDPELSSIDSYYASLKKLRRQVDSFIQESHLVPRVDGRSGEQIMNPPHLAAVMGIQYDVTKDVRPFTGDNVLAFTTFRAQWDRAATRLREIGKGHVQLLQELKRVLGGQALQLIEYLPETDNNYTKALSQLSQVYDDPTLQIKCIVDHLIDMPVLEDTKESLLKGYSSMNQTLQSLESLNLTPDNLSTVFFIALCERKPSSSTKKVWKKFVQSKSNSDLPLGADINREAFLQVLLNQAKLAPDENDKSVCLKKIDPRNNENSKNKVNKGSAPATFFTTEDNLCGICQKSGHKPLMCFKMHRLNPSDLEQICKESKLCTRCFEPYTLEHRRTCQGPSCTIQGCPNPLKHCKWIHYANSSSINVHHPNEGDIDHEKTSDSPTISITKPIGNSLFRGILRTCVGYIKNPSNPEKIKVRFLLDAAAEQNLVRRQIAQVLGLDGPRQYLQMNVAGGGLSKRTQERNVQFQIQSLDGTFLSETVSATTILNIAQAVKPVEFTPNAYKHLEGLNFTETYPSGGELQLDVLIGEPMFTHLCVGPPITGNLQEPAAQNTRLGWIMCGAHPRQHELNPSMNLTVLVLSSRSPITLQSFWHQEHLGITPHDDTLTVEEEEAMALMEKVTSYDKEKNKWSTRLLWKEEPKGVLSPNFQRAKAVMTNVENRTKEEHWSLLNEAYLAMENMGTAEKVPKNEIVPQDGRFIYYLETHPILKPNSSTPCRVVMNASSKDPCSKKSINDLLFTGPNLLPNIAELQLRFRAKRIAFIADIAKMFLAIALDKDQDALRFLWRNFNQNQQATIFRMVAVTFGINSSPFQAIWCLLQTAELYQKSHPLAAEEIRKNLYMDDLASGRDDEDSASHLLQEPRSTLPWR